MDTEILVSYLGQEGAAETIKLIQDYDSYVAKFKEDLNKLLVPLNYEVKTGILFSQIKEESE